MTSMCEADSQSNSKVWLGSALRGPQREAAPYLLQSSTFSPGMAAKSLSFVTTVQSPNVIATAAI